MRERLREKLKDIKITWDAPMARYTSFRIGGPALALAEPANASETQQAIRAAEELELPYYIIGNGTNLLVSDEGLCALVIRIGEQCGGIAHEEAGAKRVFIAGAGESFSALAKRTVEEGCGGLEWAAGIPGTVGGAVAMNAGAYGGEVKSALKWVELLKAGEVRRVIPQEGDLGYRTSRFSAPDRIVMRAAFQVDKDAEARERMMEYNRRRQEKQPLKYPSAGSTFKRPAGFFAGTLIDEAGLKGKRIGGAEVSTLHAGFIINAGGATARDVMELIRFVQDTVCKKFGVCLEPEVRLLGKL